MHIAATNIYANSLLSGSLASQAIVQMHRAAPLAHCRLIPVALPCRYLASGRHELKIHVETQHLVITVLSLQQQAVIALWQQAESQAMRRVAVQGGHSIAVRQAAVGTVHRRAFMH